MKGSNQQQLDGKRIRGTKKSNQNSWTRYWEEPDICQQMHLHRVQAADYVTNLETSMSLNAEARVLDFGCGFGFVADKLSEKVEKVFIWDASDNMRSMARKLLARRRNIKSLNLSDGKVIPRKVSFDLIIVNSVVQYMNIDEFSSWLVRWRTMLAPNGRIILSDVIRPDTRSMLQEICELLAFCARRGVLMHTLWLKLKHLRQYRKISKARSLMRVGEHTLRRLASVAGMSVEVLPANLTHLSGRYTVVLSRQSDMSNRMTHLSGGAEQ